VNLAPLLDADKIQRLEPFGEDTWDLLHAIQDSFGVEFTADDLIAAKTVGKLGECISKKLMGPRINRCLSAVVFHRLRRAFVDLRSVPRQKIHPDTGLDELLPWSRRTGQWEAPKVGTNSAGPDLPGLARRRLASGFYGRRLDLCGLVSQDSNYRTHDICRTRNAGGMHFKLCVSNAAYAANRASVSSVLQQLGGFGEGYGCTKPCERC
jgi:hypothetical protein